MQLNQNEGFNIAIVGATGLVGKTILSILMQRNFPINNITLIASQSSSGIEVEAFDRKVGIISIESYDFDGIEIAFFSAGTDISLDYAPIAAQAGAIVIDNTNAFRMDVRSPLVVPFVNEASLTKENLKSRIIANPNCSTIQLVQFLKPLDTLFDIEAIHCVTYQAASGGGNKGIEELVKAGEEAPFNQGVENIDGVFAKRLAFNVVPEIDVFLQDGSTLEEQKIKQETRKILGKENIRIYSFAVRVSVVNCHSEAVIVKFRNKVDLTAAKEALKSSVGITFYDGNKYATPKEVSGSDEVHIGRLHIDNEDEFTLKAWVVADNVRVGASLNSVQIAESLVKLNLV